MMRLGGENQGLSDNYLCLLVPVFSRRAQVKIVEYYRVERDRARVCSNRLEEKEAALVHANVLVCAGALEK